MFFAIFLFIYCICFFHVRFSSKMTPKNLISSTCSIFSSKIFNEIFIVSLSFVGLNSMDFVFLIFNDNLLAFNHDNWC